MSNSYDSLFRIIKHPKKNSLFPKKDMENFLVKPKKKKFTFPKFSHYSKRKKYLEILSIIISITSYVLYYLSLGGCDGTQTECLKNSNIAYYYLLVSYCFLSAGLTSFLIFLIVIKHISKLHLIHMIIIYGILFLSDTGSTLMKHGIYNIIGFIIFFIFYTGILFIVSFVQELITNKSLTRKLIVINIVLLVIIFSRLLVHNAFKRECKDWDLGLNNTRIKDDINKYPCQINRPISCHLNYFNNKQDLSKLLKLKCSNNMNSNQVINSRNLLVKYINRKEFEKTKRFGFPLTNTDKFKIDNSLTPDSFTQKVFDNIIDMDNPPKDLRPEEYPEVTLDFKEIGDDYKKGDKSLKYMGKININVTKNEKLSIERKSKEIPNSLFNNILMIYTDAVSRAHFKRKMPKTCAFIEKLMKNNFENDYYNSINNQNDIINGNNKDNVNSTNIRDLSTKAVIKKVHSDKKKLTNKKNNNKKKERTTDDLSLYNDDDYHKTKKNKKSLSYNLRKTKKNNILKNKKEKYYNEKMKNKHTKMINNKKNNIDINDYSKHLKNKTKNSKINNNYKITYSTKFVNNITNTINNKENISYNNNYNISSNNNARFLNNITYLTQNNSNYINNNIINNTLEIVNNIINNNNSGIIINTNINNTRDINTITTNSDVISNINNNINTNDSNVISNINNNIITNDSNVINNINNNITTTISDVINNINNITTTTNSDVINNININITTTNSDVINNTVATDSNNINNINNNTTTDDSDVINNNFTNIYNNNLRKTNNLNDKYYVYQFLKYHTFTSGTKFNAMPMFFGKSVYMTTGTNIIKYFKELGYITAQSIDMCSKEVWEPEMEPSGLDFDSWDHENVAMFCDPSYMDRKSLYSIYKGVYSLLRRCFYGKEVHDYIFEYGTKFWETYPDNRKFLRIGFNDGHESTFEVLKYLDDPLYEFLNTFYQKGYLKNTALILVSDHGNHMPGIYNLFLSEQYETERVLGNLFLIINSDILFNEKKETFKIFNENVMENQQSIITPYDIYDTLVHIIYGDLNNNLFTNRGTSFFMKINNLYRNCKFFDEDNEEKGLCKCVPNAKYDKFVYYNKNN